MSSNTELLPGEEIIHRSRPAVASFWVFFLGVLLVGFGPFIREDGPLSPAVGGFLCFIFVVIIAKRWADVYTLTNQRIMVRGGLIYRDTYAIQLKDISGVQANQGITLRLVGLGHLFIRSRIPDQEGIIMYGQPDPWGLKTRLEKMAAIEEAKTQETSG